MKNGCSRNEILWRIFCRQNLLTGLIVGFNVVWIVDLIKNTSEIEWMVILNSLLFRNFLYLYVVALKLVHEKQVFQEWIFMTDSQWKCLNIVKLIFWIFIKFFFIRFNMIFFQKKLLTGLIAGFNDFSLDSMILDCWFDKNTSTWKVILNLLLRNFLHMCILLNKNSFRKNRRYRNEILWKVDNKSA